MKTYRLTKISERNGVACYQLSLLECGVAEWEILYASEAGRQAAIQDGKDWIDGKFDHTKLPLEFAL